MKRSEVRLLIRAMQGDKEALDELERIADDDSRWSRWPTVKMAANAGLAVIVAGSGLAAAIKTLWSYWSEKQ